MSRILDPFEHEDVGETFMLETEIASSQVFLPSLDLNRPELQLEAPDTVLRFQGMDRVELPCVRETEEGSIQQRDFLEVLRHRRSCNSFRRSPIGLNDLAMICWAASGTTCVQRIAGNTINLRTAPSAGARYPCNVHFISRSVIGLEGGVFYYDPLQHCVVRHRQDIPVSLFHKIFFSQDSAISCSVMFILTVSWPRSQHKYGERGFRYSLLEAGHIGQNIGLSAEYLGLSSCGIGGYCDHELHEECGFTKALERIVYPIAVGVTE